MRFATKLTLLFSGILLVFFAAVIYVGYTSNRGSIETRVKDKMEDLAFHTMDKVDRFLYERYSDIKIIATDPLISSRSSSPIQITARMKEYLKEHEDYASMSFFGLDRVRVADTSDKDIGKRHPFTEFWPGISKGADLVVDASFSESLEEATVHFAAVVKDKAGKPFGVVVSRVPLSRIQEMTVPVSWINKSTEKLYWDLVNSGGLILYSSYNPIGILKDIAPDWGEVRKSLASGSKTGSGRHLHGGEEELFAFMSEPGYLDFKGSGWTLILREPAKEAFASDVEITKKMLKFFFAFGVGAVIVMFLFARTVSGPLTRLAKAAAEIGKGNLDQKVDVGSNDEIGRLAASFTKMAGSLRESDCRLKQEFAERERMDEALKESEGRYRILFELSPDAILLLGMDFSILNANRQYSELLGVKAAEEVIGQNALAYVVPDDRPLILKEVEGMLVAGKHGIIEFRAVKKDGSMFACEAVGSLVMDAKGAPQSVVSIIRDVTERKRAEAAIRVASERLSERVNELGERNQEISMLGKMGELLQSCHTVEESYEVVAITSGQLFPASSGAMLVYKASKNMLEAAVTWGEDVPYDGNALDPEECWALRRGRVHSVSEFSSDPPCNAVKGRKVACICVPMLALGDILGVYHLELGPGDAALGGQREFEDRRRLAKNVSEQAGLSLANLKLRETLRDMSIRDTLTGLFNRRFMDESLDRELSRAGRNGLPVSVVMFDIDKFKNFNDTYGHGAGDVLLKELGMFIKHHVRGSDIPCRYGGEEFALIMPDSPLEMAVKRAEEIREAVKHIHASHGTSTLGSITISLGVASFPEHGLGSDEVLRNADSALYRAKETGRDRVCFAGECAGQGEECAA